MQKTHRRELRYVVGLEQAAGLIAAARRSLPVDPRQSESSWVRSVFVDTAESTVIPSAGQAWNTKLRIRTYHPAGSNDGTQWFEIKRRAMQRVDKRRFALSPDELHAALLGDWSSHPSLSKLETELALVGAGHPLLPQFAVDYQRTAFQSADAALRVTFDRQLYVKALRSDYFRHAAPPLTRHPEAEGWRELVPGCVVELKCQGDAQVPKPLARMLAGHRPSPTFSKGDSALRLVRALGRLSLAV